MSDKTETKTATVNPFARLVEAQLAQMDAFYGEMAKLSATNVEQAKTALDEAARLSKETLGYVTTLANESRRMTLDACKRSMSLFGAVQL